MSATHPVDCYDTYMLVFPYSLLSTQRSFNNLLRLRALVMRPTGQQDPIAVGEKEGKDVAAPRPSG